MDTENTASETEFELDKSSPDTQHIYALYCNNNSIAFVNSLKEAKMWLKNVVKNYDLTETDYEFKIESNSTSAIIYKRYKWYVISHFQPDNIYYFKELSIYLG